MQIFGIGPLEFLLIVAIMLILLGPKEMVATAYKIGQFIRKVVKSPTWASVMTAQKEIRDIPQAIMSETGLDKEFEEIKQIAAQPGQMINDAGKDLTDTSKEIKKDLEVDMEPIEIPKLSMKSSSNSLQSTRKPAPVLPFQQTADVEIASIPQITSPAKPAAPYEVSLQEIQKEEENAPVNPPTAPALTTDQPLSVDANEPLEVPSVQMGKVEAKPRKRKTRTAPPAASDAGSAAANDTSLDGISLSGTESSSSN